jgi:hypothetical protein
VTALSLFTLLFVAQAADVQAAPALPPETEAAPTPVTLTPAPPSDPDGSSRVTDDEQAIADALGTTAPVMTAERRTDIYGFADFNFVYPMMERNNAFRYLYRDYPSFFVGALNLYMDTALTDRMRSLVEVRFLYTPLGDLVSDGTDGLKYFNTIARDPADYTRTIQWGGILIERAWVEYQLHPLLTARVGQFLTPYGIWNVDHGSPTIVGIRRPYIIGEFLFPERQSGLELYGAHIWRDLKLGYHLTLSNGRGNFQAVRDQDFDKAVGGRLFAQLRGALEGTLGGSFYKGRYTRMAYKINRINGVFHEDEVVHEEYDELSLAVDLRLFWKGFMFQSEAIVNEVAYTDRGRVAISSDAEILLPDGRTWGAYALLGYRTRFFGVMPYVSYEHFNNLMPNDGTPLLGDIPEINVSYIGVNVRPIADFVFKLEYAQTDTPGAVIKTKSGYRGRFLQAQASWMF